MHLFSGTVAEAASLVSRPQFVQDARKLFLKAFGEAVGEAEAESWQHSWPVMMRVLTAAGLDELHMFLEYCLPGTGERIDALLLGETTDRRLATVVVELKRWTHARTGDMPAGLVQAGGRNVLHPARQVGGYTHYLTEWVSRGSTPLLVRGTAMLHEAPSALIDELRAMVARGPSAAYPILGHDDLDPALPPDVLAGNLGCVDLLPPSAQKIDAFLTTEHRPSPGLLARAGDVIQGNDRFRLIGDQDLARQHVLATVEDARRHGRRSIVLVTGGPGTGKTVVACRLLGDLCAQPETNPRLLSPSGTLSRQLQRTVGRKYRGLIDTVVNNVRGVGTDSVVLLDEAHRARTAPDDRRASGTLTTLGTLLRTAAVTVLFLDENQIIRPNEGITAAELARFAGTHGLDFHQIDLTAQFRCNGSHAYLAWVDQLFSHGSPASVWAGADYDAALATDPDQFTDWVEAHVKGGGAARITAGFCWPWNAADKPPLPLEVQIPWTGPNGPRTWARAWNLRSDDTDPDHPRVPARPFWATDPGGHEQVGCVYTAQGMEYPYGVVILGPDLRWRNGRWAAHSEASYDRALRHLSADRYLRYALNIYRVLATRATLATRFYSTDPDTQAYLQSLLPTPAAW
jgi:hypothetical protein